MVDPSPPSRRLQCLIQGEYRVFTVTVENYRDVNELEKVIHSERALDIIKDHPQTLELWKVDINLNGRERHSSSLSDLKAEDEDGIVLSEWKSISDYWPEQPPNDHLHVMVKRTIPPTELDRYFLAFHQHFWNHGEGSMIFVKSRVQIPDASSLELDDNSETLEFVVIDLPQGSGRAFTTQVPKLLVVPIYETFWDVLEYEDQRWQDVSHLDSSFSHPSHATIITGQAGIGKSVFLIYVLLRRLVNGMTTIYCDSDTHVHIFDHTGVKRLSLSKGSTRIPELDHNSTCCALVNLGDKLNLVPRVFYPQHRRGRVVVATNTSLSTEHLSTFSREHFARSYYMPTWKWGPLYFASLLYARKDLNTLDLDHCKALQNAYYIFSGIPRYCFGSFDPEFLEAQKEEIQEALHSISSLDDFGRAIRGQLPFNSNTSHRLIRVEPVDDQWLKTRTEIMSNYIAELVFERIHKAQFSSKLTEYLGIHPNRLYGADILFEQAAHYSIRKGLCTLTIATLPLPGTTLDVSIPGIPVEKDDKSRYYSLSIHHENPGSHENVHPDFLDLYMTPKLKIEPSIDALFISSQYKTYLFQMTVSDSHPISFQGLDRVFSKLPANAQKDVRFVFVVPASKGISGEDQEYKGIQTVQRIEAPLNADAVKVEKFKRIPQYVCRLDMDKIGWV